MSFPILLNKIGCLWLPVLNKSFLKSSCYALKLQSQNHRDRLISLIYLTLDIRFWTFLDVFVTFRPALAARWRTNSLLAINSDTWTVRINYQKWICTPSSVTDRRKNINTFWNACTRKLAAILRHLRNVIYYSNSTTYLFRGPAVHCLIQYLCMIIIWK